jgi:hypothetical protein
LRDEVDNIPGTKREELIRCTKIGRRWGKNNDAPTATKKDTIKESIVTW